MGYGLDLAMSAGTQAAGNFINEGMGLLFQPMKNKQQLKQARRLQDLSLEGEAIRLERNRKAAMQMWHDTNYGPQVEEMKKAGINPALLYGMGGGGGTTASVQSGGVSEQRADTARSSGGDIGMGIQLQLMSAQKEALLAKAELDRASAKKTGGVDTELAQAQTGNAKADTELKRLHGEIAQVAASVSRQTINEQMRVWEQMVEKNDKEIKQIGLQNKLSEETMEDQKKLLNNQVATEAVKAALMNAQKENTDQDTKVKAQEILESEQRIKYMAGQLLIGWTNAETSRLAQSSADIDSMGGNKEDWEFLEKIAPDLIVPMRGLGKGASKPVGGFHKR